MSRTPRITDSQVADLRQRRKAGAPLKELAADFAISMNYVCRLCNLRDRKPGKSST